MKRRAYRATDVKDVRCEDVMEAAPTGAVTTGLDIGKSEIRGVLRWSDGSFERPWKVENPVQIDLLVGHLREVAEQHPLIVAMESTGTYGDVLRAKLHEAGLVVHRVGGKAAHDYAEVFDGVPSQHDSKDAAVIAELAAFGKSTPWPFESPQEADAELAFWVEWLDAQTGIQQVWTGRLESLLARHWPELTGLLELTSPTLLELLAKYGGAAPLAADPQAARHLARWGGNFLTEAKIERIVASAAGTVGVGQIEPQRKAMRRYAAAALEAYRQTQEARGHLKRLAKDNATIQRQAQAVGETTACVLWAALGDPANYRCGEAYRKAMGLNLKERSSGQHQGQLKITKRGPSIVRRWLYFAAMRTSQSPWVRPWFEAKKARDQGRGKGALIAVCRKLALALHAVGAGEKPFEIQRLFPSSGKRQRNALAAEKRQRYQEMNEAEAVVAESGGSAPKPPGFNALTPRIG